MINDSKISYGIISKTFHWLMALLIIWQLFKFSDRISDGEHWIGQTIVPWHVSIGFTLMILIIMRLIWGLIQRNHRTEYNIGKEKLVKTGHCLLYIGMLLVPFSGIMLMLGGGYGLSAFGFKIFPSGEEITWASALGELHSPLI